MVFLERSWKKIMRRIVNGNIEQSFALDKLDKKLASYIDYKNGFFIEAGANNGVRQSNSLYFERYKGWRGLLIEQIPDLARECSINRPKSIVENCALVSSDFTNSYVEMEYCNLMSVVRDRRDSTEINSHIERGKPFLKDNEQVYTLRVPAMTLSAVLNKHSIQHIDLLSLDVEGYEAEVLRGVNFEVHQPKFMLIEVRQIGEIESIICPKYKPIAVLNISEFYSDILYKLRD